MMPPTRMLNVNDNFLSKMNYRFKKMRNSDSTPSKTPLPHVPCSVHSHVRSQSGTDPAMRLLTSPSTIAMERAPGKSWQYNLHENLTEIREINAKLTFVHVDHPIPARTPPRDTLRSGVNGTDRERSDWRSHLVAWIRIAGWMPTYVKRMSAFNPH